MSSGWIEIRYPIRLTPYPECLEDRVQTTFRRTTFSGQSEPRFQWGAGPMGVGWNFFPNFPEGTSDRGLGVGHWWHEIPFVPQNFGMIVELEVLVGATGELPYDFVLSWHDHRATFPFGLSDSYEEETMPPHPFWVDHAEPELAELPEVHRWSPEDLEPHGFFWQFRFELPTLTHEAFESGAIVGFRIAPEIDDIMDLSLSATYDFANPVLIVTFLCPDGSHRPPADRTVEQPGDGSGERLPGEIVQAIHPYLANPLVQVQADLRSRSRKRRPK